MLHAEDLVPGTVFELGTHEVTEQEIVDFARQWDPLPFHVDPEAAEQSAFGGLIASGMHTMAISGRLTHDALVGRTNVVAGFGMEEMRLPKPVRPGSVVTGTAEIVERRMRDDGRAVVVWVTELCDQAGDVVLSLKGSVLVRTRAGQLSS